MVSPPPTRGERCQDVERRLQEVIQRSVTSAAADGRTVLDPAKAAYYATNALLYWNRELLAEAAELFARRDVEGVALAAKRLEEDA